MKFPFLKAFDQKSYGQKKIKSFFVAKSFPKKDRGQKKELTTFSYKHVSLLIVQDLKKYLTTLNGETLLKIFIFNRLLRWLGHQHLMMVVEHQLLLAYHLQAYRHLAFLRVVRQQLGTI